MNGIATQSFKGEGINPRSQFNEPLRHLLLLAKEPDSLIDDIEFD
jgi:hypothetical protein